MDPASKSRGAAPEGAERALRRLIFVFALGALLYAIALSLSGEAFEYPLEFTGQLVLVTVGGLLAWLMLRIGARMAGSAAGCALKDETLRAEGPLLKRRILLHVSLAIGLWTWSALSSFDRGFPWPVLCGPAYAFYLAARAVAMCSADWRMGRGEDLKLAGFTPLQVYRARMLPVIREAWWATLVFVSSLLIMTRGDLGNEWLSFFSVNWFLIGLMLGAMHWAGAASLGIRSISVALGRALAPLLLYAGLVYWIFSMSFLPFDLLEMLFSARTLTDFLLATQIFTLPMAPGAVLAIWCSRDLGAARPLLILKSWAGLHLTALGLSLLMVFAVFVAGVMRYFVEFPCR